MLQTRPIPITLPFGDPSTARVLVIGHDPLLHNSGTCAKHAFFADMYFKPIPNGGGSRRKYELAKAMYDYITWLCGGIFKPHELYFTNLCNETQDCYYLSDRQKGELDGMAFRH